MLNILTRIRTDLNPYGFGLKYGRKISVPFAPLIRNELGWCVKDKIACAIIQLTQRILLCHNPAYAFFFKLNAFFYEEKLEG